MKTRLVTTLSLLIALLAACAPSTSSTQTQATQPFVAQPAQIQPTADLSQPISVDSSATLPAVVEALPIATSRGDALEATDPSTVSLASGELHFVEFFRFT